MFHLVGSIKDSHYTRLCVLLAICCVTVFIFISLSANDEEKPSRLAKITTMSGDDGPIRDRMTGGLGAVKEKDDEVTSVVDQIKPVLEEKTNKKFESLEVLHYKTQVVAGKNYFVKVKAKEVGGPEQVAHLRIYKDIKSQLQLTQYQLDKKPEEELVYFQ